VSNIKLGMRSLWKNPFVSGVAIVSLALGIGANTAIFSLFNDFILSSLPVSEPDRLVNLGAPGPKPGSQSCNNAGSCEDVFSYQMFRDLEGMQDVFTGIAAHRSFGANLAFEGQTMSRGGMLVSGSYFSVLGLRPALGRLIGAGDDAVAGESAVAVLSHAYWRNSFGEDPDILGETLIINGHPMTIIGVAPEGFEGTTLGTRPQVYVPITMRELEVPGFEGFDNRRSYWLYLFARLNEGVSIEQAHTALNLQYSGIINEVEAALQSGMSEQTMARFRDRGITVVPGGHGQSDIRGGALAPLSLLYGVTALVLLIACANIANLLLARGAARSSEMAVRLSIGAGRGQLIGQLLTESCLLAAFGGVAGILVARWTLDLIRSLLPDDAATLIAGGLNPAVLACAAALALGTGLLFGIKSASRFRTALAVSQIALSMTLLVAAGLFTRSLVNVSRVDLGLDTDGLVTFGISPEFNGYAPEASRELFERTEEALAALPGVTAVSAAMVPVLAGSNWVTSVSVEGFEAGPDTDVNSRFNLIGAGYFRALGIPLLSGREFIPSDTFGTPRVAIVNEEFARKFNLGREAVGKRIETERTTERGQGRGAATVLLAIPAGRERRSDQLLRENCPGHRTITDRHPAADFAPRPQPARRGTAHAATTGRGKRVSRSLHHRAGRCFRQPGDVACRRRPLRRPRLYRGAAHPRDRPACRARSRPCHGTRADTSPGGTNDPSRGRHRPRGRRRARCRLHPSPPRLAPRPDESASHGVMRRG